VAYRTFFTGKACLTLLVFIGLSGCSIPTIFDHQITWNTPYLNQTECPDLDGTYQNRGKLYGLLIHLVRNIQRSDEEGTYRSIKYAPTPPEEYMRTYKEKSMSSNVFANSSLSDKEYERKKTIFLREQSVITIKRPAPFVIEATLGDKMGRQYQKSIYSFENQSSQFKVGCYRGALVTQKIYTLGGAEFTPVTKHAYETQYRKLANGDLEVTHTSRDWWKDKPPESSTAVDVFKLYHP